MLRVLMFLFFGGVRIKYRRSSGHGPLKITTKTLALGLVSHTVAVGAAPWQRRDSDLGQPFGRGVTQHPTTDGESKRVTRPLD